MKTIATLALLSLAAVPAAVCGETEPPAARSLSVARPEAAEPFKLVRLDEKTPVEFLAEWTQQMPTPGWTFEIDSADFVEDRIVVKLTEVRPEGLQVQMIAPGTAKIPLGSLQPGRYVLEIRSRRNPRGEYVPAFATVLIAR